MTNPAGTASIAVKSSNTRNRLWSWLIYLTVTLYFLVPLGATFYWSLRGKKDVFGFEAYRRLFADTNFFPSFSESIIRLAREHNDANVLVLPARFLTEESKIALEILRIWLATPFEGGRHQGRVDKIEMEQS